jgi:Protein of unknown function (DUF1441)
MTATDPNGHGGKREGAGRKPRGWYDESSNSHATRFAKARADKEESIAQLRKIQVQRDLARLKEDMRDLLRQSDVERRFAEFVTTVAMFLDTLPDILERDAGISGDVVERVQAAIDKLRAELHAKLEALYGG